MKQIQVLSLAIVLIVVVFHDIGFNQVVGQKSRKFTEPIPLCDAFTSDVRDEKTLEMSAFLYIPPLGESRVDGGSDSVLYSDLCNNKDYFSVADFSDAKNLTQFGRFVKNSSPSKPKLLRVTVAGKLLISLLPTFGELGWLRSQFRVERINSIDFIASSNPIFPDFASRGRILNSGESLRSTNFDFVSALFGKGMESLYRNNLFTDSTEIRINEKEVAHSVFLKMCQEAKTSVFSLRVTDVSRDGSIWTIRGTGVNKIGNGTVENISYDNRFQLQADESWKLVSLRVNYSEIVSNRAAGKKLDQEN